MRKMKLPTLDPATLEARKGSGYPEPFRALVAARSKKGLGDALGLKNFGVNLTTLPPGTASAQRHWHAKQDEFVYIVEGELTLVTDAGEQVLTPGMVAGFPAGQADGHFLVNKSAHDGVFLEVGDRTPGDVGSYPDIDLEARDIDGRWHFFRKDGTPY